MLLVSSNKDIVTNKVRFPPFWKGQEFLPFKGDTKEIEKFLQEVENDKNFFCPRFFLKTYGGKVANSLSLRSIKSAIKRGFDSSEIYMYINSFEKNVFWRKGEPNYIPAHSTSNFKIDLDNVPYKSINQLLKVFKNNPCLTPDMIIQTNINNFHLVVLGAAGQWNDKKKRIAHVCKMFGVNFDQIDEKIALSLLKNKGVDPNSLLCSPDKANIRIPGTVNFHNGLVKKTDGSVFTCKVWKNTSKIINNIPVINEENILDLRKNKKKHIDKSKFWIHYRQPVYEVVFNVIKNKKISKKISDLLCNDLTWLQKDRLQITQTSWAKELEVDQPRVSRIIRSLVNSKILKIIDNEYIPGQKSKVYGMGTVLFSRLEFLKKQFESSALSQKDNTEKYYKNKLNMPYYEGDSLVNRMADIRFLHKEGVEFDDVVDFCYAKQSYYGKTNMIYLHEIRYMAYQWFNGKAMIKPKKKPPNALLKCLRQWGY